MRRVPISPRGVAESAGPFSPAVKTEAALYLSGQIALDPVSGELIGGGAIAETERIMQAVGEILESAGRSFSDVVRVGVYLTDMADYAAMNKVYARYFAPPYPARTCVCVKGLPFGASVEVDLVAM